MPDATGMPIDLGKRESVEIGGVTLLVEDCGHRGVRLRAKMPRGYTALGVEEIGAGKYSLTFRRDSAHD